MKRTLIRMLGCVMAGVVGVMSRAGCTTVTVGNARYTKENVPYSECNGGWTHFSGDCTEAYARSKIGTGLARYDATGVYYCGSIFKDDSVCTITTTGAWRPDGVQGINFTFVGCKTGFYINKLENGSAECTPQETVFYSAGLNGTPSATGCCSACPRFANFVIETASGSTVANTGNGASTTVKLKLSNWTTGQTGTFYVQGEYADGYLSSTYQYQTKSNTGIGITSCYAYPYEGEIIVKSGSTFTGQAYRYKDSKGIYSLTSGCPYKS